MRVASILERWYYTAMGNSFVSLFCLVLYACAPENEHTGKYRKKVNASGGVEGLKCDQGVTRPGADLPSLVTLRRHWASAAPCPRSTHWFLVSRTLRHRGRRHHMPRTSTSRTYAGLHQRPRPWIAGQHPVCTGRNPRSTASRNRAWYPQRRASLRMDRNRNRT